MTGSFMIVFAAVFVLNFSCLYAQSPEPEESRSGDFFVLDHFPPVTGYTATIPTISYSPYSPSVRSRAGFIALVDYTTQPTYSQVLTSKIQTSSPVPERSIRSHTLRFTGEYGLRHNTMLSVQLPVIWLQSLGTTQGSINPQTQSGRLAGLSNLCFSVKYRLNVPRYLLSASLRLSLPSGKSDPNSGLATGFNTFLLMPMLHVGVPTGVYSYGFLFGGYGLRTRQYGQVLQGGAAFGYRRRHVGFELASVFFNTCNSRAAPLAFPQKVMGLYHPQQSFWTFDATFDWRFRRFLGLNLGVSVPAWGRFYPKIPALEAAAYFQWD